MAINKLQVDVLQNEGILVSQCSTTNRQLIGLWSIREKSIRSRASRHLEKSKGTISKEKLSEGRFRVP